jgi:hypothetical protein
MNASKLLQLGVNRQKLAQFQSAVMGQLSRPDQPPIGSPQRDAPRDSDPPASTP